MTKKRILVGKIITIVLVVCMSISPLAMASYYCLNCEGENIENRFIRVYNCSNATHHWNEDREWQYCFDCKDSYIQDISIWGKQPHSFPKDGGETSRLFSYNESTHTYKYTQKYSACSCGYTKNDTTRTVTTRHSPVFQKIEYKNGKAWRRVYRCKCGRITYTYL